MKDKSDKERLIELIKEYKKYAPILQEYYSYNNFMKLTPTIGNPVANIEVLVNELNNKIQRLVNKLHLNFSEIIELMKE